ncbi:CapA family protein [Bailinhaonella thermotolerans]|uniref:CapA family protein n=1 Tax=Bailinhaonella thermotolerans TaxID=1070861 RepID=A0A3A4AXG2_9ACTN|nr:CapA family protein [Bailinhaonella thermotolerans]RJL24112.1 CapA family protein [Bailinhaonella thermotolerans]
MSALSAAALALGVLAACSSAESSTPKAATKAPAATPKPDKSEPLPVTRQPFTISFGGDVHFEGFLRARLANPSTALGPIASTLRKADLAMVNLETAITMGGTPAPGKQFKFRAPESALTALKASGVDVVSMANNHGMDFMESGLRDSLKAIKKAKYPVVGIGKDADEAYKPWRTTVKGNRVAILGATQVLDDHLIQAWTATDEKGGLASAKNVERMVEAVKEARAEADTVIVYLHWGAELQKCPLPRQPELAKRLIKAGADVIVGGHAHIPLAGGYMNGKYVHYGLGNFVFSSANGQTANSGVLTLTLRGGEVLKSSWRPARISGGLPRLLTGPAAQQELARWKSLRSCTTLEDAP